MSRTYSLGCKDCKVEIWIGQGSMPTRRYLYFDAEARKTLESFLFNHLNHHLSFYDDEGSDFKILNMHDKDGEEAARLT